MEWNAQLPKGVQNKTLLDRKHHVYHLLRRAKAVEIGVDHQVAFALRGAVENDGHGVGGGVFDAALQIGVELILCGPKDHSIQQPQFGPDSALRERGIADPKAVGIKKPLNGGFKHLGSFRLEAVEFTGIQNIRKLFFLSSLPVRAGAYGWTDFFLTRINLSFFFLTGRLILRL